MRSCACSEFSLFPIWRRRCGNSGVCVRRGGQLAVTTWGPNLFESANTAFWSSIKNVRAELYKGFNPWDRINDPAGLEKILNEGGVEAPKIIAENRLHLISSAEDWWTIVLGSGYRGTIEQLNASEREKVKKRKSSVHSRGKDFRC